MNPLFFACVGESPAPLALRGAALLLVVAGSVACGSSGSTAGHSGEEAGSPEASVSGSTIPPEPPNLDRAAVDVSSISPNTWTWVPVAGTHCRDGSSTGFGINVNPGSTKLMIFLEGGGACFNAGTCLANPANFNSSTLASAASGGILSRTDNANPVKDWNFVYVPFCTGDLHIGNHTNATVSGVAGTQQFVGYVNMQRDLARIVPTFPGLTKVLLTGISAGGFGAAANYPQTARAFAPVPVFDLDDSGPFLGSPYMATCLQQEQAALWGLDKTVLLECGSDCVDAGDTTVAGTIHTLRTYPNIPFGLIEDTADSIITLFFGYGANNCASTALLATPEPSTEFTAGLLDLRARLEDAGVHNFGSFIFQGSTHTSLHSSSSYDTETAGGGGDGGVGEGGGGDAGAGVLLSDWVTSLVNDSVTTNIGP